MISLSCTSCSKFFFCKKDERVLGKGCPVYVENRTLDFLDPSSAKPRKSLELVVGKDKDSKKAKQRQELLSNRVSDNYDDDSDYAFVEDYSNYFLQEGALDQLNLPESDFPLAKNIYDFIVNRKFLDSRNVINFNPYPKQLEIFINYLQEYCPKCSDVEYVKNIPTDASLSEIFEKVVLLEHEVCPRCFKTKLDFLSQGLLKDYLEMAGLAGQRCLAGNTKILTDRGEIEIERIVRERIKCNVLTHRDNWKPVIDWFDNGKKKCLKITSINGHILTCTEDHKLYCLNLDSSSQYPFGFFTVAEVLDRTEVYHPYFTNRASNTFIASPIETFSEEKGYIQTYDLTIETDHSYIANDFVVSNSGKSQMVGIISTYTLHRFLKLEDPFKTFDIARTTILQGTFLALNKEQIMKSIWPHIQGIVRYAPWFSEYNKMLDYYGRKIGRPLVNVNDKTTINYFHKNIRFVASVPNIRTLRGGTNICGAIDEIGWFNSEDGSKITLSADEVYGAVANTFGTIATKFEACRRKNLHLIPQPTFTNVSSPSHSRDKICSLVSQGQKSGKLYWYHYPTWEINPDLPKNSEFIQSHYSKDPIKAERDFGANPPLSSNPFIENPSLVDQCFDPSRENKVILNYNMILDPTDLSSYAFGNSGYKYKITGPIDTSKPRVLTLDLGYNNNSTAFSIGYWDEAKKSVVVDTMNEIIPTMHSKVNLIDFLESIIKPLIRQFNIQIVCADRWNTLSLFQEIEKKFNIKTLTYDLSYGDFQFFKQSLLASKISFPAIVEKEKAYSQDLTSYPFSFYNLPNAHFLFQVLTVVDDKKGEDDKKSTVRKGEKTTDDIFRTAVLLHYILTNYKYREDMDKRKPRTLDASNIGCYVSSSGQRSTGSSSARLSTPFGVLV